MRPSFLVGEALRLFTRAKRLNLLSLGALTMAMMALGLAGVVQGAILRVADFLESRIEVVAFVSNRASDETIQSVLDEIRGYPRVAEVTYRSREAAAEEFAEDPALAKYLEALGENPLPASLRIQLREKTPENIRRFVTWLKQRSGLEEVTYGGQDADRVLQALALVRLAVMILLSAMAAAAVIIVGNIISLMVFARRHEIQLMQIIGATPGFVRAPFLIWGVIQGAAAGLLAAGVLYGLWRILDTLARRDLGLSLVALLPPDAATLALQAGLGLLGAGALLGLVGSLISIGRQWRP